MSLETTPEIRWTYEYHGETDDEPGVYFIADAKSEALAEVYDHGNARLMTAAPEMKALLLEVLAGRLNSTDRKIRSILNFIDTP